MMNAAKSISSISESIILGEAEIELFYWGNIKKLLDEGRQIFRRK